MPKSPPSPGGSWCLVPYITERGRCQVLEWLEDELRIERPAGYIEWHDERKGIKKKLEQYGPEAFYKTPTWKRYGDGLCAIRWERRCRIYCSVESGKRVVMYHGCLKGWREFAHETVCNQRRKDFLSSEYDQQLRERRYLEVRKRRGQNGSA